MVLAILQTKAGGGVHRELSIPVSRAFSTARSLSASGCSVMSNPVPLQRDFSVSEKSSPRHLASFKALNCYGFLLTSHIIFTIVILPCV